MQAYMDFRAFGLGHVVWLTISPEMCNRAVELLPELGCVYSSQAGGPCSCLGVAADCSKMSGS